MNYKTSKLRNLSVQKKEMSKKCFMNDIRLFFVNSLIIEIIFFKTMFV